MMRVGQGFDVHRFSDDPERLLTLGGVVFAGARGLEGHSDADVIAHACADALLGSLGETVARIWPSSCRGSRSARTVISRSRAIEPARTAGFTADDRCSS